MTEKEKELQELDWWIDEYVFGNRTERFHCPRYTTDDAAAIQVLEKIAELGKDIGIVKLAGKYRVYLFVDLNIHKTFWQESETLPLAICQFAKQLYSTTK